MKTYLLFPALTSLDLSFNRLRTIPPTISLLSYLCIFNVSSNIDLEYLPPELGLLDKLWNIGIRDCALKEPLKNVIDQENYKTAEILSVLRNKLDKCVYYLISTKNLLFSSKIYPKIKLMFLGGAEVGKTTLLKQMRQEGHVSKKMLQSEVFNCEKFFFKH